MKYENSFSQETKKDKLSPQKKVGDLTPNLKHESLFRDSPGKYSVFDYKFDSKNVTPLN